MLRLSVPSVEPQRVVVICQGKLPENRGLVVTESESERTKRQRERERERTRDQQRTESDLI